MNFNIFTWSLNTRISILSLACFLIVVWSQTFYATHIQRKDIEHLLSDQQASTVEILSADINADLNLRLKALETVAEKITPAMLGNAASLQAFLEHRSHLADLFNTGAFVTRSDGIAVACIPIEMGRIGTSYIDRDYIIAALREGKPNVGSPVIGKHQKTPVFSIAVPIRTTDGKLIGAVAGVTNLGKPNFLDRLQSKHYGKSGGYVVVAPQLRQIVTATDKKRVMEILPAPGMIPFIDRAISGYEGSAIFINPLGVEVLASTKVISAAGWYVTAILPTAEAFAPHRWMLQRLMLGALILSLVACCITVWFIRSQRINKFLEHTVDERTKELHMSELRYRSFVENINDVLFVLTPEGLFNYVSPQWKVALGYEISEVIGRPIQIYVHPDDVPRYSAFLQRVIETGEKQSGVEYRLSSKDGDYLWYTANASLLEDPDTGTPLVVGIGRDITKRRLAEKELEASEKHYHRLVETSQDLIWQTDAEDRYIFLNLAWEQVFGYELSKMIGRKFTDFQAPETALYFQAEFRHLMEGHSMHAYESTCIGKNGEDIHLVINALFLTDENGEFTGACGTAYDITARKYMEDALRKSEEKYRFLLEGSSDAVFAFTPEGRYKFANRAFSVNVGKPLEQIIGGTLWDVFPKEEADKRFSILNKVFKTGEVESLEVRIPATDGDNYYITTLTPVKEPDGNTLTVICAAKNITQLKKAEIELLKMTQTLDEQARELQQLNESLEERVNERTVDLMESQNRIDQLSEQNCAMIWEVDVRGLYTYVNRVSEQLFGYLPEEMIGKMHFYDVFPETEQETIKKLFAPVFENRAQILNQENQTTTRDGRNIWWSTNGVPLLSADGTLLGYRGIDTDITERKKLKEQLMQSQKMEAVGQLAGGLAHDFNNVLSIISGYCSLLQIDFEQDETQKEYLDRILAASYRAGELTHSMLAFSRTQVMHPKNHDLNEIISKTGAFVEKIIRESINFKTVITTRTLLVYVDRGQIEQVLINLANNARDAMPDGGELHIATDSMMIDDSFVSAHGFGKPGCYAVITASDTGTGMDEATRKKIFEPFFTTKAVDKGTGLGLAMVYGIVKQHQGFVEVTSKPGQGASFMIYLPIVEAETTPLGVQSQASLATSAGTETILIVEDDAALLEYMRNVLAKHGYRVICAVDGQDAVDKFRDNADSIKLIIMDMIMPNKSGKAAYDEIKQIRPDARALFSSGYSANIIPQQGELGENAMFISKPVKPAELMAKVREMLNR